MPLWKMRKGDAISFLLSIPMIQVSNLKRCHGKTIVLMNEQLDSPILGHYGIMKLYLHHSERMEFHGRYPSHYLVIRILF